MNAVAAAAPVRVTVVDSTEPDFSPTPTAARCHFYNQGDLNEVPHNDEFGSLSCDAPLRGGMRLYHEADSSVGGDPHLACSAGFQATIDPGEVDAGRSVVLTAGHCVADTQGERSWQARTYNRYRGRHWYQVGVESPHYIVGQPGDAGMVFMSEGPWSTHSANVVFVGKTGDTRRAEAYVIRQVKYNAEDEMVCMTGSTNGTRCGEIEDLGVSNEGNDFQAKVDTCAGPGDSGGPVYIKGQARGLIASQKEGAGPIPGCSTYFQGARPTELALGVTIRTR